MEISFGSSDSFSKELRSRIYWITLCIVLGFIILVMRLWYLQIVQGGNLQALAENNRLREVAFPDFRGNIFDRNGIELVSSRPSFDVILIREDISDLDEVLDKLEPLVKFNRKTVKKEILSRPAFEPFRLSIDVSRDAAARIEEHRYELPGISLAIKPIRIYRYGSFATHLIGYLGEISASQMKEGMFQGYKQGDIVGKYGIEKVLEPLLRGKKGKKLIEVDAAGRELKILKMVHPGPGKDIFLSIDFDTQMAAEKAMLDYSGALVAMKPSTGEILALVSSPGFDLNRFAYGVEKKYWKELLNNPYHPLNNRTIQGQYSPGSTYKIVMALAGLEEGVIDEDTEFLCKGHFTLGRKTYRCWNKGGHGKVSLIKAIEQSCDVYFYNLGLKLGVDTIASWASKFGLNRISGIALEHEKKGLIPTSQWKEKYRHEPWIMGETLSIAIGQGFNLVTPLQMAGVISGVANGGYIFPPRLLKVNDTENSLQESLGSRKIGISEENLEIVRRGLYGVVNVPGGTGRRARIRGITVAGKTGTAQVVRQKEDDEREADEIPERFRDHAWFVSYAPFENPEIAVSVILEHAGHGGAKAAPVAQKVMKTYLKKILGSDKKRVAAK